MNARNKVWPMTSPGIVSLAVLGLIATVPLAAAPALAQYSDDDGGPDDGAGLPEGAQWPVPGKMTALIVQSLKQNAGASLSITSAPGAGMQATITFKRANAAPEHADIAE